MCANFEQITTMLEVMISQKVFPKKSETLDFKSGLISTI